MLSKNKIKFIQSLDRKKEREASGCFLAEGNKLVGDTLPAFRCHLLVATEEWLAAHPGATADETVTASPEEIARASLLRSPQSVLAVFRIPEYRIDRERIPESLSLVLDTVQDPGNLGTIVRLADWFGIEHIFCSPECADVYNPKTVQATMGALARTKVFYQPLEALFAQYPEVPVYGTFLDGEDLYEQELSRNGFIVMGNEGKGISPALERFIGRRLYLPPFPAGRTTSESLNVAVATAVVCAEFRRRERLG
ncbi:MAG: RNA methyltransferase [Coprobacter sp.]|nr:RNA methyltransferase [Coprobacter sp.]